MTFLKHLSRFFVKPAPRNIFLEPGHGRMLSQMDSGNYHLGAQDPSGKFDWLIRRTTNTPLIEILFEYEGKVRTILVKNECLGMTGTAADRVALSLLQKAYLEEKLFPHMTIVEAGGTEMALAMAAAGRWLGHETILVLSEDTPREKMQELRGLGAECILTCGLEMAGRLAEQLATHKKDIFFPAQLVSPHHLATHLRTTASESWMQLQHMDQILSGIVAHVRTGATVMGLAHFFRQLDARIAAHPVSICRTGKEKERLQPFLDEGILDREMQIDEHVAHGIATAFTKQLGIPAGIRSGANIAAAICLQERLGEDSVVMTILADSKLVHDERTDAFLRSELTEKIHFLDHRMIFV